MTPIRAALLLPLVLAGSALACGDLREIMSLQQGLVREFQVPGVGVNLNNSVHLTVTFSNSPAADLPDKEQAAFARRVAEYVRDNYASYSRLQTVSVGFATVRGSGAVQFTSTRVPYRFTPLALGQPLIEAKRLAPKAGEAAR